MKVEVFSINNVSKVFYLEKDSIEVLNNLNLKGYKGEIIGIVGPSGSGKSTILNILSKILKPTSGDVLVNGKIGYMFQKDHLLNWLSIYHNILLGLEIEKKKTPENIERTLELLNKYNLKDFINSYPKQLSGGMKQRIALIRTLSIKPDLLLLDEPFSALDFQTRIDICDDVYKMIKDQNICAILVTHDISEAISMCDRVVLLSNRPTVIKKEYNLGNVFKDINTPFERRTHPLFNRYFNEIWAELRNNE